MPLGEAPASGAGRRSRLGTEVGSDLATATFGDRSATRRHPQTLGGIDDVDASAEHGDRPSSGSQRAAVGRGIDPICEPRDHRDAPLRELTCHSYAAERPWSLGLRVPTTAIARSST